MNTEELRLSSLTPSATERVTQAADALLGSGHHSLTRSEEQRLQMYVGNLESMLERIRVLLEVGEGLEDEDSAGTCSLFAIMLLLLLLHVCETKWHFASDYTSCCRQGIGI